MIQMQFLGNIQAKLDSKMRVFVPAIFRKILLDQEVSVLILRKDIFQECLVLYPINIWEIEVQQLRSRLSRWDKKQQQLFRQFVVDAERLEIDANGRILISRRFLQMINAEMEIQFLGVDNTIEIWKKGTLNDTLKSSEDFGADIQAIMNQETEE